MQKQVLDIDELAIDTEYIALEKDGAEIVDLYNECSLESTDLYNGTFVMKFLKITDSKRLGYHDVVEVHLMHAVITKMIIDNVLDDWTSLQYIKRLSANGTELYEMNIAEMTLTIQTSGIVCYAREATVREIEIHETKRSFRIPIEDRTVEQKSLMSKPITQERVYSKYSF